MEVMETGKAEGLSLRELEAHSRAELLPDRVEMRRVNNKTIGRGNLRCDAVNVAGGNVWAWNKFLCQRF